MYLSYQRITALLVTCIGLVAISEGRSVDEASAHIARAEPENQPHGYQPQVADCPSRPPSARSALELSPQEREWLRVRRKATIEPMKSLFSRLNIKGFDAVNYIDVYSSRIHSLPNIGIAISGGGYRAMTNGAGVVAAFDSRTINSTSTGGLGGILQSATYLSGLSGGSWLVGSLYANNFTSVQDMTREPEAENGDLWQLENSIFEGPHTGHLHFFKSVHYFADLIEVVKAKRDAGFNTTITDYWGRALSYQLINAGNGGPDYTYSSIADQKWFTSGTAPLPILVSDARAPNTWVVSSNSTIYEFNPWELGSWDPTTFAFTPMKYIGTNYTNGMTASKQCVTGFDTCGFLMGTSSSLFNAAFTKVNGTSTIGLFSNAVKKVIEHILTDIDEDGVDIASYPNPFYQFRDLVNPDAASEQLTLTDGGEDGQNIPLTPLIQPLRRVDVIFAVDSSADTTDMKPARGSAANWPDGTSLIKTYERSLEPIGNSTAFPAVPDSNTFLNLGLTLRPTFFGCNAKNTTSPTPLIVYLPNGYYSAQSNVSTYDLDYPLHQRDEIIQNAYNMATQGNGTLDSDWAACVGCAILSRSFERTKTRVPETCKKCFHKYCWNGTTAPRTPSAWTPAARLPAV